MKARSGFITSVLLAASTVMSAASLAAAASQDSANNSANASAPLVCPQLHVIAARETTAPPGFGSASTLVDLILKAFPGATSEAIVYPAAGNSNRNYSLSVTAGVLAVLAQVTQFAAQCPGTVLVMHGYSQGAQILDNAFCGGPDGDSLLATPPLIQTAIGKNVAAIIMMGNPRHVAGLPYNVGNATAPGFAARPVGFQCPLYQARIQSYCDSPDPFCANGTDAAFHQGYGTRNGGDALQFIVGKVLL
ncbi:acetyl xylan esterase (Axe1) [Sporothrix brasiliensis 5110]|uniref:Acetyl xylan esterase (Axe1) n=1 Tax=Sporothrix brasiliensis 5110 TaxID=1398154 RepID=A0A0C2F0A5_9PEZI|nr:acetyl xylan esterase (Axe1) [Sporothrix brasiliensis 5110]KIH92224.1 acetyl xylan esterase (Axe1) [Sporothrix brasiliensis 5110]